MNSNTVNLVYSFNSAVLECEYKINTLVGKTDRAGAVSPLYSPNYKCFLKYEINNKESICCFQNYGNEEEKLDEFQEENDADTVGPINMKRLGISWRKQTKLQQKRKRQLSINEQISNENNSTSCLLSDQQRLLVPRIPIAYRHEEHQYYNCNMSKTNFGSIISEKETPLIDVTNLTDTKCIKTLEEEDKHNFVVNVAADADDNNKQQEFLCAKREKRWLHHKHRTRSYSSILNYVRLIMSCSYFLLQNCKTLHVLFVLLLTSTQYLGSIQGLLVSKSSSAIGMNLGSIDFENASALLVYNSTSGSSSVRNNSSINNRLTKNAYNLEKEGGDRGETYLSARKNLIITSSTEGGGTSGNIYQDTLDSLERSLAAVLIKVAYGTTSTTKRSIPENSYVPSLTTIATPLLTTLSWRHRRHGNTISKNWGLSIRFRKQLTTINMLMLFSGPKRTEIDCQ